ncbi:MAG: 50S ribosomal protein L25/general stress protein Ctc [Alphaproteobacteria bacterium]|nr:50S ribosomal protein L25/general stress protein Ctc [Alphaproteobacteria bacterium]
MAEIGKMAAERREQGGKGTARAARRAGLVPAVIYGNNEEPVMVTVEQRMLERELQNPNFFIHLLDLEVDGTSHRVLPRDAQFHPVTDRPQHVDFLRYSATRKLNVEVPVTFENEDEAPGIRQGGVLNIVRHSIEVLCTADRIPDGFEIDLTGLNVGDSIHASAITLPEGVEFAITDRDFTIATIAAPTVALAEDEEEGGEGEEEEGGKDDGKEDEDDKGD